MTPGEELAQRVEAERDGPRPFRVTLRRYPRHARLRLWATRWACIAGGLGTMALEGTYRADPGPLWVVGAALLMAGAFVGTMERI